MAYSIRILFLNQGEPPPTKRMDVEFATVQEAWDAGMAQVLAFQLRSTETAFQVIGPDGQIVEVTAKQANSQLYC